MKRTKSTFLALVLLSPMAANAVPLFFDVDNLSDILSISVNESGVLGEDWVEVISGGIIPTFTIQETAAHIVTVSFDSGRTDEFQMVLNPAAQPILPILFTNASFSALSGTESALYSIDNNSLLFTGSELLEDFFFSIYDPDRYRLTETDGVFYDFRQGVGLQHIVDPLGQQLVFGTGGVLFTSVTGDVFTSLDGFTLLDRQGNLVSYGDVVSEPPVTVPEPGTLALFGIGLFGMGMSRRKKKI